MDDNKQAVQLISTNNLCVTRLAAIARVCTTPLNMPLFTDSSLEKDKALVKKLYAQGHWSVFEHASMTFLVECSRACSLQLARHRHVSRTEMSQRYVRLDGPLGKSVVIPPTIIGGSKNETRFLSIVASSGCAYQTLLNRGVKPEDARFVLPEAMRTRMVLTLNLRTLLELRKKRMDNLHAQWEIRGIVRAMWRCVPKDLRACFDEQTDTSH